MGVRETNEKEREEREITLGDESRTTKIQKIINCCHLKHYFLKQNVIESSKRPTTLVKLLNKINTDLRLFII